MAYSKVFELLSCVNKLYDSDRLSNQTLIWIIRMCPRNDYIQHLVNYIQSLATKHFRPDFLRFARPLQFHSKRGIPRKREIMVILKVTNIPPIFGIVETASASGIDRILGKSMLYR